LEAVENKLYQYSEYKKRIEEQEKQIAELMDKKDALAERMLRGQNLDAVRVMGGLTSDPVFAAVQKMVDVYGTRIDAIRKEIVNLYYLSDDIMRIVNNAGLTEAEREYIQCRYFDGLRASQTAARIGYSEDHARKIKRSAIAKIRPLLAR
jgi:DNA-directed RNA polymerase specialized sigma24 family protein